MLKPVGDARLDKRVPVLSQQALWITEKPKQEILEITPGAIVTEWVIVDFSIQTLPTPTLEFPSAFEEPRTIADLAKEQRQFLSEFSEDLEDVNLPPVD